MLSRKDIIAINQEFHTGKIANAGSLDYAVDQAKRSRDWLKAASLLIRSIIRDHVFEDGNKRTAAAVICAYVEMQNLNYNKERVDTAVLTIAKKNMDDIRKIGWLIKNALE